MSSRRRSSSSSSPATGDQMADLISRLQALLPPEATAARAANGKLSRAQVLQETCNHIRRLHREVDSLSEKLSELLESSDHGIDGADAAQLIRSMLM